MYHVPSQMKPVEIVMHPKTCSFLTSTKQHNNVQSNTIDITECEIDCWICSHIFNFKAFQEGLLWNNESKIIIIGSQNIFRLNCQNMVLSVHILSIWHQGEKGNIINSL